MDLSQLMAMLPGLFSGPYAVPVTLAIVFLVPMLAKKFPALAALLSFFKLQPKPADPLAPLIQPPPADNPLAAFPLLNSILSRIMPKPAEVPPAFLLALRDELAGLIDHKAEQHAAELEQMRPEPSTPVVPAPK